MADVELVIGKTIYTGWERVRVAIGLEQIAGEFSFSAAGRWPNGKPPILKGMPCSVRIMGETVIKGYVRVSEFRAGPAEHAISVSGHDAATDLVDSAVVVPSQGFEAATLSQIAAMICAQHGIRASVSVPDRRPFDFVQLQPGETGAEVLGRLARMRGGIVVSDGAGGVLITQAGGGGRHPTIEYGRNVLGITISDSDLDQFHQYVVKGQDAEGGYDDPAQAQQIQSIGIDNGIRRGRVTYIDPGDSVDDAGAAALAAWTASSRRARGLRVQSTMQGWRDERGDLWRHNRVSTVIVPEQDFRRHLLISQVEYSLDPQTGTTSTLTLVPVDAYTPPPVQPNV